MGIRIARVIQDEALERPYGTASFAGGPIRPMTTAARARDAVFRSTDDSTLRVCLQIVLFAHRGRPHRDIAIDLGVHRRTVTRWLNAYSADGLDGLRPEKAQGTPDHTPPRWPARFGVG